MEGISRMLERYHVDGHAERIRLGAPSMRVDPIAFTYTHKTGVGKVIDVA